MKGSGRALELWSPLPPLASGIADYVEEQLAILAEGFSLTLVVEEPGLILKDLTSRYRVIGPRDSDPDVLRLYHLGNSPLHGFIYSEAVRVPGIVFLHEWNLHELVLGFAVTANDFGAYRQQMRREHGERGSVAAETVATALGGRHWTGVFPLNLEVLETALAVVCLSGSTAARVAARIPETPLLHLPHHAFLRSGPGGRSEARARLGLDPSARVILAPGLGTASKSLAVIERATETLRSKIQNVVLVTVGGGASGEDLEGAKNLGRVDLETLGDALLAADVVVALRFPSRGEASGVVMRTLAAGRALIVSAGSTADEDLPQGVVARVNPGPGEASELAALFEFLLTDEPARQRLERLARTTASALDVASLTKRVVDFVLEADGKRDALVSRIRERASRAASVREPVRRDLEAAAQSLGLAQLPPNVFERLVGW